MRTWFIVKDINLTHTRNATQKDTQNHDMRQKRSAFENLYTFYF